MQNATAIIPCCYIVTLTLTCAACNKQNLKLNVPQGIPQCLKFKENKLKAYLQDTLVYIQEAWQENGDTCSSNKTFISHLH